MSKTRKAWYGSKPDICQCCLKSLEGEKYFFDANHRSPHAGRFIWGIICETCFDKHGIGLGIGKAQKYENHPPYYKVEAPILSAIATYADGTEKDITNLILNAGKEE